MKISTPEDDPSVEKLKEALSKRAEMEIIGYNYQQERSFDTLENAVSHGNADAGFCDGSRNGVLEWDSALEERWETSSLLWHRI